MSAVFPTHTFHGHSRASGVGDAGWMSQARAMLESRLAALGTVLAVPAPRPADALRDETTGLYNSAGLLARGDALLAEARRGGKALGLVVLDFNDLREVRAIYGSRIAGMLRQQIVKKLRAIAGTQGQVARTGKTQFAILLPGQCRERALKAVHRVMGQPARVELDSDGEEIVLVPDWLAENIAPGDEQITRLQGAMLRELEQQRMDEARRCDYLQRERERHSRPMHLPALPARGVPATPRHASTVPIPLSVRR